MIEALNFSLVVFTYKMAFAACIRIDELDDFLFILMFDYETILHTAQYDIAIYTNNSSSKWYFPYVFE